MARRGGVAFDGNDTKSHAALMEAKVPIDMASPAFVAEIRSKTSGIEAAWVAKAKTKGADGAALLAELRKEIAAYKP